jgi:hypothetical protein
MNTARGPTRLLLLAQAVLWLAAAAASALLVYWLYIDPVYGMPWSAETGAVLFTLVGVYAAAGCVSSLFEMVHSAGVKAAPETPTAPRDGAASR